MVQVYDGDGEKTVAFNPSFPTDNQDCWKDGWFFLTFNHITNGPKAVLYAPGAEPQWSRVVANFDNDEAGTIARDAANRAMARHR